MRTPLRRQMPLTVPRGCERYLVTAKRHGADLAAGLAWVFDQLARRAYTDEEAIALLPDRWPKAPLTST